jgi:hypothetical protein
MILKRQNFRITVPQRNKPGEGETLKEEFVFLAMPKIQLSDLTSERVLLILLQNLVQFLQQVVELVLGNILIG